MAKPLPKLAIYMARGLEGGGVTNYVRHLKGYYDSIGGVCDIYSPEFTNGRPKTSVDLMPYLFDEASFPVFYRMLAPYDAVLVMGTAHKKMPEWYVSNYVEQLAKSRKRIILYVFDHHYVAYKTYARYGEMLQLADVFLSYSKKDCVAGVIHNIRKHKHTVAGEHKTFYNFFHNELLSDFTNTAKREKKIIHLTRSTLWKRPGLLANSHEEFAERDWIVEIMGMERSINTATFFRKYGHKQFFKLKRYNPRDCVPDPEYQYSVFKFLAPTVQRPDTIYMFGPYRYYDGMNRVAQSAFSFHPITFEHNQADFGGCAEFIFLESCLLAVPIAQQWALDRICLPYTQTPLATLDFILPFSDDNAKYDFEGLGPRIIDVEGLIDRMDSIYRGSYKKTRENLIDFMENVYSARVLVPKLLEDIGLG
jgi:hypothetical protein